MFLPAEERGVASRCADFQENKEIDPIPFAVLCLVLSNPDMFESSFNKNKIKRLLSLNLYSLSVSVKH